MTKMSLSFTNDFPQPTQAQWRELVDKLLQGGDFEKRLVAWTEDGIAIQPLYVRLSRVGPDTSIAGGTARRGLGWDICQIHAEPDPATANAAILDDLADGATSIQLQIAAPGWSGLPYEGASLGRALDGVLLEVCPIALVAGEYTPDAAGSLMALWRARGIAETTRLGAFNYDPLATLAETGALYHPAERALGIAAGLVRETLDMPAVTALTANGSIWHFGGATEAQELACVLGSLVAYLRACETAEIAPAESLPKMAVTLAVDADQMMGLAKFRAMRLLLARLADACGAGSAAARVPVTAETSRRMMTRRDPWVNLLRTTMACATAAMGGADRIVVLPFSWAIGKPDAFARRIARNTHHVLIEEAGLGRVFDPAAGSFAIEALTRDLAAKAWALFQEIEAKGGMAAALQSGFVQEQLAASQAARMQRLAQGQIEQTGTSAFPSLGSDGVTVAPWPQDARSADLNGARCKPLVLQRLSEPFERLRDAADDFRSRTGKAPAVFLAELGRPAESAARATWVRNVLAAGGIETIVPADATDGAGGGFLSSVPLGAAFGHSGLPVAVLCGTDAVYGSLGEAAASVLKQAGARMVVLAGRPKGQEAALKLAGVDMMLYAGSDRIATLKALQEALQVAAGPLS